MLMAMQKPAAAKKPKIPRRDVEYHQAVARGRAGREASQRGYDPQIFAAVSQGERGKPTPLGDGVTLRSLALQVQLCLSEYAFLMEGVKAAGLHPPTPEKKLLHYVAMFADPVLSFEHLTDYEATAAARYRDFDALAFGYAAAIEQPGATEKATAHIMRELGLLSAFSDEPMEPAPGKPEGAARPTRPRRGRLAGQPPAG